MKFGRIQNQINLLEHQLAELYDKQWDKQNREKTIHLRLTMEQLMECQEIKLAQKAHQLWLLNGDKNTKYFHLLLAQKRARC